MSDQKSFYRALHAERFAAVRAEKGAASHAASVPAPARPVAAAAVQVDASPFPVAGSGFVKRSYAERTELARGGNYRKAKANSWRF